MIVESSRNLFEKMRSLANKVNNADREWLRGGPGLSPEERIRLLNQSARYGRKGRQILIGRESLNEPSQSQ